MGSSYRPQSPDLSYAPQSPDLSGFQPQSPNLSALGPSGYAGYNQNSYQGSYAPPQQQYGGHYSGYGGQAHHQQSSTPQLPPSAYQQQYVPPGMNPQIKFEDAQASYDMSAAPEAGQRARRVKQEPGAEAHESFSGNAPIKAELPDPTLGCQLKTSFPVARIKRLMQADEDIGKVAQVTPTVVSRALELFMIKLISASADQARGAAAGGGGAAGKGPKRILAQHLKKAVLADDTFDFLREIVAKVPDAPTRAKKDAGSDSEDGGKPRRRGKKRKDSTDDF